MSRVPISTAAVIPAYAGGSRYTVRADGYRIARGSKTAVYREMDECARTIHSERSASYSVRRSVAPSERLPAR